MGLKGFFLILFVLFLASFSFASEQEIITTSSVIENYRSPLPESEIFARTQDILNYYQVPPEADPASYLADLQGEQNLQTLQKNLKFLDQTNMFANLFVVTADMLTAFQDLNVKNIFDFKFEDFTLENYNPEPHIKAAVAV